MSPTRLVLRVHIDCNIVFQSTQPDDKVDDICLKCEKRVDWVYMGVRL